MKKIIFSLLLIAAPISLFAQLKVNSDGKVIIASNQTTPYAKLLVGNTQYGGSTTNAGITGSTSVVNNKNNIGIFGTVGASSGLTGDKNYGVLGIMNSVNITHGRNYGLCGMIGFTGTHYGGAGLYATSYTYYFNSPTNIQGDYAGYFDGSVKVTGNITAPSVYIPVDSRLNENVVSLNERGEESSTLDNLLAMNVIEYNMKSRLTDDFGIGQDKTEEEREAYEYLKKDEMKMSSRRHFGIDAEELQKVYPDLVLEGQDGYLAVNYVELVPVLIRSIQELKEELDEVKGTGEAQKAPSASGIANSKANAKNVLYQNTPNPFKEQTIIRFRLADDAQDAAICIFDMQGKMLRKLPISSGDEQVGIGGYELGEGMFLYSLIVNGQEIDTKKMVISK